MKSRLVNAQCSEPKNLPFPKLMRSIKNVQFGVAGGVIILFDKPACGTALVQGESNYPIGIYANNWAMQCFEDLPIGQSVVLENDGNAQ